MLSNDPRYFSCVMTSPNYAVFLPRDSVLSVIAGQVIFNVPNTRLVAMTRGAVASVLVPLCYHDYISATRTSACNTYSRGRESRSTAEHFICCSYMDECSTHYLPWACCHCANTRFSGQGQAAALSDMTKQWAVEKSDLTQLLDS